MRMSRKVNCWDNKQVGRFGTLKPNVYEYLFATREQAKTTTSQYMKVFYNRQLPHSACGYQSPAALEQS